MSALITIGVIVVLLLLNALFVAAEFAIVGVPRASIERRAAAGDRAARRVAAILRDPRLQDRYIATAQLGITVASLGLGMYGEHAVAEWIAGSLGWLGRFQWVSAHAVASVVAVAMLTYFHIVVGEMIPKSLALQRAEHTALWVTPLMLFVQRISLVLVVTLNGMGNAILRLFGVDRRELSGEHVRTPEELQYIIRESEAGGLLRRESANVVQELLEIGDLTAGEVMVPRVRVTGIPVGATFAEVAAIVRRSPHSRYPVYEESLDRIIGMVHIKDLFRRLREQRDVHPADARPVPFVPETSDVDTLMAAMRQESTQMAVVMDEHGGTAGIVTIEDLFEEVVGEIEEGLQASPDLALTADGVAVATGTVRLDELGEILGIVLEHEEVDTVSGLVLALLDRPPHVGDEVEYDGVRVVVTAVEGHGVGEVRATLTRPPPGVENP